VVLEFLADLETSRGNTIRTRKFTPGGGSNLLSLRRGARTSSGCYLQSCFVK